MTMRVYEFSKQSGISSKDLIKLLQDNGFDVVTHMSILSEQAVAFLESSKKQHVSEKRPAFHHAVPEQKKQSLVVELRPMTIAEFCESAGVAVNDAIVFFLKKGVVAPRNFVLSEKQVEELATQFQVQVVAKPTPSQALAKRVVVQGSTIRRAPIVVVVGHVDHGKTTLLDYIRKTRVAEKEKGGITQHIGAYEVKVQDESLVFLDTPGHEAFQLIRVRGVKVADIAILVVAADDGIMPQTLESIKVLREAEIPVIVALNKIDKASSAQVEAAKRGLTQHGLVPEEWGGQTIIVSIAAKLGTGVSDLLDVLVLQSQMMDLFTDPQAPASGFVIEAKMEKGRGPVATVITHTGILRVGDFFSCGATVGKVSALVDSRGKLVKETSASLPVAVVGFEELPAVGSVFAVIPQNEYREAKSNPGKVFTHNSQLRSTSTAVEMVRLIVRADNMSSLEAITEAVNKLSIKAYKPFHIILSGIGIITENDVILASDSDAIIYGFHTKVEKDAQVQAQKLGGISIRLFDIIYKMLDDLALLAEHGRPIKMVSKKLGEAVVLKVFDIKGLGVIAGSQVKSGKFSKDGKVIVYRGKYKVGEGSIRSLQKDKKAVKEVAAGFECGFMVDGFNDWIVDDRVECFIQVPDTSV